MEKKKVEEKPKTVVSNSSEDPVSEEIIRINKNPLLSPEVKSVFIRIAKEQNKCRNSYKGMKCIPAGEFIRGSNSKFSNEHPAEKVYISEFYMDTYEVTNEDFRKCLDAGKCSDCLKTKKCKKVGPNYGWRYRAPKQPILGISWYSAKEYCEFMGKRLPTEAEWEKAARGPESFLYPWGNTKATCMHAIIEDELGRKGCVEKKVYPPKDMPTREIGTRPPGIYGLYDMAGNSWEWVNDFYTSSYAKCGEACKRKDPRGPCAGKEPCKGHQRKIVKGGSWWWDYSHARGARRRSHDPKNYPEYHHFGFRCAKD
ncbi:MAG: formylglycine-generating enzyme family protein [Leptospiraceae bacterium]|nr:formylglycine-generating enzyme family protein [Leptospiraceae bacterium]